MQTISYAHLLSPAMHSSVSAKREQHLHEAARLETEVDLLTHEGRALIKSKNPQLAAKGRRSLAKAEAKQEVLRAHLIRATDLTDYDEPEPNAAWLGRAFMAAAEAGRSLHRFVTESPNPAYARHTAKQRAA